MKEVIPEVISNTRSTDNHLIPLESLVEDIRDISTLPEIAMKVMDIACDPNAGIDDLKSIIESDPALSGRILRTVNSAAYALSSKVTNLHHAISLLGFVEVRNLAFTVLVAQIFREHKTVGTYRREGLWRHMISVGICARIIAKHLGFKGIEDCYLAGILHDIGIILEDQYAHSKFCQVIENLDQKTKLTETERKILGFDHTQLGARIAEKWNFPPVFCAAIRHHHAAQEYTGEGSGIVRCVEVANHISALKGYTSVGMVFISTPIQALQLLNLQIEDVVAISEKLEEKICRYENLFEE
jgi:putative nucleotidyltransferase with HDIG domain